MIMNMKFLFFINNIMLSDNKNIQEQTNSLGNSFKNIASMTNPNKEIPEKSNYGKLTPQEKQSEYIISRYPNGIINIHDGLGGDFVNYQSQSNQTLLANQNVNNLKANPQMTVKFPKQDYDVVENFDYNIPKSNNYLYFIFILLFIIIICSILKLFK